MTPDLVTLSLRAGVQSTTLGLLAINGVLPKPDVAIFADTGWEPAAVYRQVDRIAAENFAAGQLSLLDLIENGEPDGCSPYGCRSGAAS